MTNMRELTLRGMILGALITVVFTASNVYLGLKVGLTFSSAIPAAVISMAVLRMFANSNILENNMVQTQASAAGTLSSIIFVLPGLLMIGYWQSFPFWQTLFICAAGGMMGVVFSIPLRHVMVVKSTLPYPEGVAAAEILKAGAQENNTDSNQPKDNGLKDILLGGIVAAIIGFLTNGLRVLSDSTALWFRPEKAVFQVPMGFSLALLSAGYLVGITSGMAILLGTVLSWGIAIPVISAQTILPEGMNLSSFGMSLWATKVRYIGAGTLAIAAVWTLITLIKPMTEGIKMSFKQIGATGEQKNIPRTEQDLSPKTILILSIVMAFILMCTFYSFVSEATHLSTLTAWTLVICSVIFAFIMGFLVAAACGYMAGLVGSSASPISGIGIIAVVVISLLLLGLGEFNGLLDTAEGAHFATALALFVTSAVLAMATIANDNLQDLKTGYLLQATPWRQQVALLIGCVVGAIVIAPVLDLLYEAYGFAGAMPREGMDATQALSAPQATLMMTIAKGIFSHQMDWSMIIIGLIVGASIILIDALLVKTRTKVRIPALAVGMGIYLPPAITMPLIIGAVISWYLSRQVKKTARQRQQDDTKMLKTAEHKGALFASGLIVGESLMGVAMAVIIVISISSGGSDSPLSVATFLRELMGDSAFMIISQLTGLAIFIAVCILFSRRVLKAIKIQSNQE